jgi:hypothetical protein
MIDLLSAFAEVVMKMMRAGIEKEPPGGAGG